MIIIHMCIQFIQYVQQQQVKRRKMFMARGSMGNRGTTQHWPYIVPTTMNLQLNRDFRTDDVYHRIRVTENCCFTNLKFKFYTCKPVSLSWFTIKLPSQ